MSLSILRSPDGLSSVYGPVHWLVDSTNVNRDGFQYLANIYTGTSFVSIISLPVDKRPVTGYGLLDVSSVLRPYIDHERDLVPNSGGFIVAPHYALKYNIQWGESSNYFRFYDSLFHSSGYVMFSSNTGEEHSFIVGDEIIIQQDSPYLYDEFNGNHTVYEVVDPYAFTIAVGFQSGPVTPGNVYRADGGQITQTGLTSGTSIVVGYGFDRLDLTSFDSDVVLSDLLTDAPDVMPITMDSQGWIPVRNTSGYDVLRVITQASDGSTIGVYEYQSSVTSAANTEFAYVGIGPVNLLAGSYTVISGPSPIFSGDVYQYNVAILSATSTNAVTELRTFRLDDRCQPHENFKLLFCDKKGAWMPFDFYLKSTEEHTVKKRTFTKAGYAEIQGNNVVYKDKNRGFDPYSTEHIISYTVRSEWLTQEQGDYLLSLLMTSRAYWCINSTTFVPIVLDDSSIDRQYDRIGEENRLIRYEATYTKAYKQPSIN